LSGTTLQPEHGFRSANLLGIRLITLWLLVADRVAQALVAVAVLGEFCLVLRLLVLGLHTQLP
jgi:hypothetical protein